MDLDLHGRAFGPGILRDGLGCGVQRAANGLVAWHNGDAGAFGAFVGLAPDRNVGVIILTNENDVGLPDAYGLWMMDRILGNPEVDYVTARLATEKAHYEAEERRFARPANPRPSPPLASLTGAFVNPSFGETSVEEDGGTLVMKIAATGARFSLTPLDGNIFVAQLLPTGRFGPIVGLSYMTRAFAGFQMTNAGKFDLLRLTFENGQPFEFPPPMSRQARPPQRRAWPRLFHF